VFCLTDEPTENLLMKERGPTTTQRTAMWFDQDLFKGVIDEDLDEQIELDKLMTSKKRKVDESVCRKLWTSTESNTDQMVKQKYVDIKPEPVEVKQELKQEFPDSDDEGDQDEDDQSGEESDYDSEDGDGYVSMKFG